MPRPPFRRRTSGAVDRIFVTPARPSVSPQLEWTDGRVEGGDAGAWSGVGKVVARAEDVVWVFGSGCLDVIHNSTPTGVGKLTQLASLFRHPRCSNHHLIDVVAALHERDDPAYQPLRRALRHAIFDSLININAKRDLDSILSTESRVTTSEHVMHEYLTASRREAGNLIFSWTRTDVGVSTLLKSYIGPSNSVTSSGYHPVCRGHLPCARRTDIQSAASNYDNIPGPTCANSLSRTTALSSRTTPATLASSPSPRHTEHGTTDNGPPHIPSAKCGPTTQFSPNFAQCPSRARRSYLAAHARPRLYRSCWDSSRPSSASIDPLQRGLFISTVAVRRVGLRIACSLIIWR
ncbi:hypothetical protein C8R44DRAFT_893761 [Mycena epipterygia]|nr:hypothetical protein C8R44DRAFT_893761 [Mycena epipterygia]